MTSTTAASGLDIRRKNFRTKAGLLELPPELPPHARPVDLGGGVRLWAYGLCRDPQGNPSLARRAIHIPLVRLFEHGLGPATRAHLTLDEARTRPLVKVGDHLWLERAPRFLAIHRGELTLTDTTIPVAEHLFVTPESCWVLPLDGRPQELSRHEALDRFSEASIDPWPRSPRAFWPPPVPPVAVVVSGDDEVNADRDAALRPLLKRPFFALPSVKVCLDTETLLAVPVIRSTIVHTFVATRTAGGIFHPDRTPPQDATTTHSKDPGRGLPLIVFGHDPRVWTTVAHLYKGNL